MSSSILRSTLPGGCSRSLSLSGRYVVYSLSPTDSTGEDFPPCSILDLRGAARMFCVGFEFVDLVLFACAHGPSTYTQIGGPLRAHGPCTTYLSVDPVNLMKHVTPHCAARSLPAGTHKCVNTLLQMRSPERSLGHSARGLAVRLSCVLCCSALAGCAIFGLLYDCTLVYEFWLGMRLPP